MLLLRSRRKLHRVCLDRETLKLLEQKEKLEERGCFVEIPWTEEDFLTGYLVPNSCSFVF